jgi:hypothetical protein
MLQLGYDKNDGCKSYAHNKVSLIQNKCEAKYNPQPQPNPNPQPQPKPKPKKKGGMSWF